MQATDHEDWNQKFLSEKVRSEKKKKINNWKNREEQASCFNKISWIIILRLKKEET